MSWSATVRRVRDTSRPLGQRVGALHSLLAQYHAPLGFLATRARLRALVGATDGRDRRHRWTEQQVLDALAALEASRATHLRYREVFAERRRSEKSEGRRSPTAADLRALHLPAWEADVAQAGRRLPGRRERRRTG